MRIINQLKRKYNGWLFKKYGFERGSLFEKIPFRYKIIPLFSPSLYSVAEGCQVRDWVLEGMEEAERWLETHPEEKAAWKSLHKPIEEQEECST